MNKSIAIILVMIGLTACQPEGRVFVEHKELSPDVEWLRKDVRKFNVPIEDNEQSYNLSLSFRYANGYQHRVTKIKVTEISPSKKMTVKNYELKVIDAKGNYIGDPALDIWDSEHVVEFNKKYTEKGIYTYTIEHNMPNDPLNFAMEIGIILDEIK